MNVVFDRVEVDCDARDGLPLNDELYGVACKEVVLGGWGGKVKARVGDVSAAAEGEKVFLPSHAIFCRLGALGSGDFVSDSASKIVETSSALGWKRLQCCSCGNCCERVEKRGSGLEWLGNREI